MIHDRTATQILWRAAGCPVPEGLTSCDPAARCWWCARPVAQTDGIARAVKTLSDTIHDAVFPSLPASPVLCAACGWTLSDWVSLPAEVWGPALDAKLADDGRVALSLGDDRGAAVLIAPWAGGRVAVFARPKQGATGRVEEAAWQALRPRFAQGDGVDDSPVALIDVMPREAVGWAMVGKFRNYDHVGVDASGLWRAFKAKRPTDRAWLRSVCLSPPPGIWTCAVGDGQKHAAIHAPVSDGRLPVQALYLDGAGVVAFQPAELGQALSAFEALVIAGVHPEEVVSGDYRPTPSIERRRAVREHDPVLAPLRGGGLLALADLLRRSTDDLRAAGLQAEVLPMYPAARAAHDPLPAPVAAGPDDVTRVERGDTARMEHTHVIPDPPLAPDAGVPAGAAGARAGAAPADGPRGGRPAGRQLGLFG